MSRLFGDVCDSVREPYLRRACRLAERGRGTTSPNPVVGCVLVRDGRVVGEGWHERAGGPHAEAVALASAGDAARGSTAYVTLEPCAHVGRTPSCASALIEAGVGRAVIGTSDPHTLARGGAEMLSHAGVEVEFADDPAPFNELITEWLHFASTGTPFVRVKVALSLDGHSTLVPGSPSRISGREASALTMRLRSEADAVMVGVATALSDDPALTVRGDDGSAAARQPRRVLLGRASQPPASLRMLHDGAGVVTLLAPEGVPTEPMLARLVDTRSYALSDGLAGALNVLGGSGVVSLLVEAGPRLLTALYDGALIDELVLVHGGGMAGTSAPDLYLGADGATGSLAKPLHVVDAGRCGADAVTVWRPDEEGTYRAGTDRS